jgi:hypothetical protein
MKICKTIRILSLSGLLLLAVVSLASGAAVTSPDEIRALTEEATIWGFPIVTNYRLLSPVFDPSSPLYGRFNTLRHGRALSTAKNRMVRGNNNDTLYSIAILDLGAEPMVFHMPDMGERYYAFQFIDLETNNIGYIGTRATGNREGWYAVTGPGWRGQLPQKIRKTISCPSRFVLALGRTLVKGEADLPNVVKMQDQYELMPLSHLTGRSGPKLPPPEIMPYDAQKARTLDFFKYLNSLIQYQELGPEEQALLKKFALIGIAPVKPFAPASLDEPTRKAMEEGQRAGLAKIWDLKVPGHLVNGWFLLPINVKFFGDDYNMRAVIQARNPYPNDIKEACYPRALLDGDGQPLDGDRHRYILRLSKEDMTMAKYFWSLTMYNAKDGFLVGNPINRYSISDRTAGLNYGTDGSLTIDLRHDFPGADRTTNWLPAPQGPFYVVLRLYGPREPVIDGKWTPPPVKRVD